MVSWYEYLRIRCPLCGTQHLEDCPNRYSHVESEKCSCDAGCETCDWTGTIMLTVGGHAIAYPLRRIV
jgi:hypothetical protein